MGSSSEPEEASDGPVNEEAATSLDREELLYPALLPPGLDLNEVRAAGFSPAEMEEVERVINEKLDSILALARWGFSAADVGWLINGDRVELVLSLLNELRTRPRNWECTYRCLQIVLPSKFGDPSGAQAKPSVAVNNTPKLSVAKRPATADRYRRPDSTNGDA